MHFLCTTCSREKRGAPGLLPAGRRYLAERIGQLRFRCRASGRPGTVLSGRFGIVALETAIPWYDQALEWPSVARLAERVREPTLERYGFGNLGKGRGGTEAEYGESYERF